MSNSGLAVYYIKNKINNKYYIGQTNDIKTRWSNHKYELNKGIHSSIHLQRSWNKYGGDNFIFKIIENGISKDNINEKETNYIKKYNSYNKGYNLTKGGEGIRGYKRPEETKNKISKTLKGHKVSKKTREKMSKNSACYWSEHESPLKGIKLTEEHKNKISKNNVQFWKGKKFPVNYRKKLSKAKGSELNKKIGEKIYNEYHNTNLVQRELAEKYNIHRKTVSRIANCKHWTTDHLK